MNFEDFSYEELKKMERIGLALHMPINKVARTPYLQLIDMLVDRVNVVESKLKIADDVITSIEIFIKEQTK